MLKKTITFKDLDDNEIVDDFYFNLTEAEITEMEMTRGTKGFSEYLKAIAATQNPRLIMEEFKGIITSSYGERSEDGRRFIKSKELSEAFLQTDAYNVLFMELILNEGAFAGFVNGLVSKELAAKVDSALKTAVVEEEKAPELPGVPMEKVDPEPWITEDREPTKSEIAKMTKEQMQRLFTRKLGN